MSTAVASEKRLEALEKLLSSLGTRVVALEGESPGFGGGKGSSAGELSAALARVEELEAVVKKQEFRIKFLREGILKREALLVAAARSGEQK